MTKPLSELAQMEARKDAAYLERNRLVSLLSKVFPSGKKKTAIEGWSEDWHGCVYIDLPTGQASWHYHDSQAWLFEHLPEYQGGWDGHTTEVKYERIEAYVAPDADDLYGRLHTLSKMLEGPDRIDGTEHRGAYPTILDAMRFVRETTVPAGHAQLVSAANFLIGCSSPMTSQQVECWKSLTIALAAVKPL